MVDGGVLARGATLSEILPPGPLRDSVVSVEYLVHRGDYAGAVTRGSTHVQRDGARRRGRRRRRRR